MKKSVNIASSVLFLLVIFAFAVSFWIVPDNAFSEEENRSLTTFPQFSFASLADGSFSSGINSYFADQFPVRDYLVGIKGVAEVASLKGENNGVLIGKDGQLATRLFEMYKSRLERVSDMDYFISESVALSLKGLNAYAESETRTLVTLIPPRTVDIARSAFDYPSEISDSLHGLITESVSEKAGYIDLLPEFISRYNAGEYIYYRTDHHWTAEGAYIAYCKVMEAYGMADEIIPAEEFSVEKIESFYGTTYSKAGCKFIAPDTLELWNKTDMSEFRTDFISRRFVSDTDGNYTTEFEVYNSFDGWLNRDYLDKKDKYAAFLDGTHNEVTVTKKGETEREKLLLVKDSFANSMVPYLAEHFDLVIVNLAGKMTDISQYADDYGCSKILIVYNLENLLTGNNLAAVK